MERKSGTNYGTNQQRQHKSLEVRVAVLEERTERMQQDHEKLAKEVRDGFKSVESQLTVLLNRNSVSEFLKHNWRGVAVLGLLLFIKPTTEVTELLIQFLKGL